jgi:hypothetical protein
MEMEKIISRTAELTLWYESQEAFRSGRISHAQVDIREQDITHCSDPRRSPKLIGSVTYGIAPNHSVVTDDRWGDMYDEAADNGWVQVCMLRDEDDIGRWLRPALEYAEPRSEKLGKCWSNA